MSKFLSFIKNKYLQVSTNHQEKFDSSSVPKSPANLNTLFADAVYDNIDKRRPNGHSDLAIKNLVESVRDRLRPGSEKVNGNFSTGFSKIQRMPTGRFKINLPNGQTVTRNKKETELHILLQSQLRRFNAVEKNAGDFLDIENVNGKVVFKQDKPPAMPSSAQASSVNTATPVTSPMHGRSSAPNEVTPAASPTQLPEPTPSSDFGPTTCEDRWGTQMKIFNNLNIDTEIVEKRLGYSHGLKAISGAGNDCWWRSAFAAAIIQHSVEPERLADTLKGLELGSEYDQDVKNIVAMAQATKDKGITEIFGSLTHAHRNHDLALESRLKMPEEHERQDEQGQIIESAGENSCKRLASALLLKKGFDHTEIAGAVFGSEPAEQELVSGLLRALKTDVVIFNTPWAGPGVPSYPNSTLSICAQPGTFLDRIKVEPNREAQTESVIRELDECPVLRINSGHYNLHIPNTIIATSRYV